MNTYDIIKCIFLQVDWAFRLRYSGRLRRLKAIMTQPHAYMPIALMGDAVNNFLFTSGPSEAVIKQTIDGKQSIDAKTIRMA